MYTSVLSAVSQDQRRFGSPSTGAVTLPTSILVRADEVIE
jgi:hypothetical protein